MVFKKVMNLDVRYSSPHSISNSRLYFSLFQAQQNMFESSQKLDLIRHSLELHRQQLPPESSVATDLKFEIDATQSMSPGNMTFTNLVRKTTKNERAMGSA